MADTRCDLTELPASMCSHCRGHDTKPEPTDQPTAGDLGPWFTARFPGRCSNCDDYFEPGDRIRADGEGGYVGTCCGEELDHG